MDFLSNLMTEIWISVFFALASALIVTSDRSFVFSAFSNSKRTLEIPVLVSILMFWKKGV